MVVCPLLGKNPRSTQVPVRHANGNAWSIVFRASIRQPRRVSSGIARGSQRRSRPDCHRETHRAKDGIVDVTARLVSQAARRS